jgi:hypothetical protein
MSRERDELLGFCNAHPRREAWSVGPSLLELTLVEMIITRRKLDTSDQEP